MKPLSFIITITLLLLNSIVSYGQDTPILSRWREEAIVKDLLKGDIYKILVDSLQADTADLRLVIKTHEGLEVQLNEILVANNQEIWDWKQLNVLLKGQLFTQKKKTKFWIAIAAVELVIIVLWIH